MREVRYLKRTLAWTSAGFKWIGDGKHVDRSVELLGLQEAKPADTPGSKATGKGVRDALEELPHDDAKLFQQVAGLLSYISVDRPEVQ